MNAKTVSTILVLTLATTLFSGCVNVIINAGGVQPSSGEQSIHSPQCKAPCSRKQIINN